MINNNGMKSSSVLIFNKILDKLISFLLWFSHRLLSSAITLIITFIIVYYFILKFDWVVEHKLFKKGYEVIIFIAIYPFIVIANYGLRKYWQKYVFKN
jgi:hypothetical protein